MRNTVATLMLLCAFGLGPGAQEASEKDYAITFESTTAVQYTYTKALHPLGTIDALRFSKPINELTMGIASRSGLGLSLTTKLVAEYSLQSAFNVPAPASGNPLVVENNIISSGILFLPLFDGALSLGRQKVSLGPARWSNLQVASQIPFLDSILYTVPIGPFEMTQVIATLENRRAAGDLSVPFAASGYDFEISNIILSSRRFTWTEPWFQAGIGTQVLVSRPYNSLQLGDVLPVFSAHNSDVGMHNFSLLLDGTLTAIPGHRQFIMVGLDDFSGTTIGIADSGIPTIWALVGGLSGSFSVNSATIGYDIEATGTHYLWGSFRDSYALSRSIYRLKSDGGNMILPLSSPFGPARFSLEHEITADVPGLARLRFSGLLLYGDTALDLVSTSYRVQEANYSFMLYRFAIEAEKHMGQGLTVALGGGGDFVSGTFEPRVVLTGTWKTVSGK